MVTIGTSSHPIAHIRDIAILSRRGHMELLTVLYIPTPTPYNTPDKHHTPKPQIPAYVRVFPPNPAFSYPTRPKPQPRALSGFPMPTTTLFRHQTEFLCCDH